jgi:hypothetical protein
MAGAYQFSYDTWNDVSSALNLGDFSPYSQDLGAVYLIGHTLYNRSVTQGDLNTLFVKAKDDKNLFFNTIISKLKVNRWTSLNKHSQGDLWNMWQLACKEHGVQQVSQKVATPLVTESTTVPYYWGISIGKASIGLTEDYDTIVDNLFKVNAMPKRKLTFSLPMYDDFNGSKYQVIRFTSPIEPNGTFYEIVQIDSDGITKTYSLQEVTTA